MRRLLMRWFCRLVLFWLLTRVFMHGPAIDPGGRGLRADCLLGRKFERAARARGWLEQIAQGFEGRTVEDEMGADVDVAAAFE